MAVVWCSVGGVTATSAVVTGEVDGDTAVLVVSDIEDLTGGASLQPVRGGGDIPYRWEITGLDPTTKYWFALWDTDNASSPDTSKKGWFRTHAPVGSAWSHTVRVIGDGGLAPDYPGINTTTVPATRSTNAPIFAEIADYPADYTAQIGDWHYANAGDIFQSFVPDGTVATIRGVYRDIFNQPNQAVLFRQPWAYGYDDHDFVGGNNSYGGFATKVNLAQVYREFIPHYDLPETGPIYHAWQMGRVLYLLSDTRYDRDNCLDPDTPDKTMLGAQQKAWMWDLLSTTDAQALVWLMTTPWLGGHVDTWSSYAYERDEIANWLTSNNVPASGGSRTWAESMVQVTADVHAIALSSGPGNAWGGFPVMLAASMDATPSGFSGRYDLGYVGGRAQWGTVDVTDTGEQISITLTGWAGSNPWNSLTHTLDAPAGPGPAPDPLPATPPAVAEARIETGVSWCAVNDRTGKRVADLPDVKDGSNTSRLLMAYTSQKVMVPFASLPIAVLEQASVPQQTSIVQVVNGLPVWAGRVLIRSHDDKNLILATASPEQYLLQRRVTTRSYAGADRTEVAVDLLSDAGSTDLGSGMGLEIDAELTGDTVDRRYLASDQTTVYAALRELAEAGTLEWTIDLDWADTSETRIRRIIRLRNRIGQHPARPPVFETATGTSYTLTEDFSTGRYANVVTVYGDGEGVDMPRSDPAIDTLALASGAPIVEAVLHVRDAMTPEERNALATAELARLMHGVQLWDLDCPLNVYPRLGYDVGLGGWAAWDVEGPRHPAGVQGQGRIIGWDLDAHKARWQPKLLDPHEEVGL